MTHKFTKQEYQEFCDQNYRDYKAGVEWLDHRPTNRGWDFKTEAALKRSFNMQIDDGNSYHCRYTQDPDGRWSAVWQ